MFDLLSNILDLLVQFFTWVGSLIQGLVNLVVQVGKAVTSFPDYISWLPPDIIAVLVATIAVVAAYKILGREG